MQLTFDENPTRKKIIMLLKKSEHMTVAQLSKEMGITSMAVRQHLLSLEKRGIINYTTRKYGIGRPVFLYRLTERALDFFPKSYSKFVKDVLRLVESMDGRDKVQSIFRKRKEKILSERASKLGAISGVAERTKALAQMLDSEGYMVDLENSSGAMELKEFNCLIHGIVADYPEACDFELEMYRDLLGPGVERTECQRDGSPACIYRIPEH